MKITIEPTGDEGIKPIASGGYYHSVSIEHPHADPGLEHVMQLVAAALIAYGYSEKQIREYIPEP